MTLSKHVKIMITWHFLITDNLEGTLEIADHLLARVQSTYDKQGGSCVRKVRRIFCLTLLVNFLLLEDSKFMELFLAQVTDVFSSFLVFHAFFDHLYVFKKGIDKCIH